MLARLLLILLLCTPLTAWGEPLLGSFSARYDLSRNGIRVGETQVNLLVRPDETYSYQAHTEPSGVLALWREDLIEEQSHGTLVDGRPRPERYLYHREGDGISLHLELHFDWENAKVHIDSGDTSWALDIGPETLDKMVQQLAFVRDLAAGAQQASYHIADGGRLKTYQYRVLGNETLKTPLGRYTTIRADRSKNAGAPDYSLWLAPKLDYRPVRIIRRHRGARYEMAIKELKRAP